MRPRTPLTTAISDSDFAAFLFSKRVRLLRCEAGRRAEFIFVDDPPGVVAELRSRFAREHRAKALLYARKRCMRLLRLARYNASGIAALSDLSPPRGATG